MLNRCFIAILLAGSLLSPQTYAQEKPETPKLDPLAQNAALAYWQAFALMPELSQQEIELRSDVLEGKRPIDDEARKIIQKSEASLRCLHRGAKMERAAWGVAWEEGPDAALPHISKARELVRLAVFRAHNRFVLGQSEQAVDDVLAGMTLARHLPQDEVITLIPLLVDYAIESVCMHALARHLPELDADVRAKLKRGLAAVPKSRRLTDAMRGEKIVFLPWLIAEVKKPNPKQRILKLTGQDTDVPDASGADIQAFKDLDESELLPATRRMGDNYDRIIEMTKLSPKEVRRRRDQLFLDIKKNGAKDFLSRWLLPSVLSVRMLEVTHLTRLALLDAGLAVLEQGPKALEDPKHRDPFGDGPFDYRKTETGFVLTSDWLLAPGTGKKLSLTFGKPAAK